MPEFVAAKFYGVFTLGEVDAVLFRFTICKPHVDRDRGEPAPLRLVTWQPEPQPRGLLGKTTHENTVAAELVEKVHCGGRANQAKQCRPTSDVEPRLDE